MGMNTTSQISYSTQHPFKKINEYQEASIAGSQAIAIFPPSITHIHQIPLGANPLPFIRPLSLTNSGPTRQRRQTLEWLFPSLFRCPLLHSKADSQSPDTFFKITSTVECAVTPCLTEFVSATTAPPLFFEHLVCCHHYNEL